VEQAAITQVVEIPGSTSGAAATQVCRCVDIQKHYRRILGAGSTVSLLYHPHSLQQSTQVATLFAIYNALGYAAQVRRRLEHLQCPRICSGGKEEEEA
jgi:hypothetical protein